MLVLLLLGFVLLPLYTGFIGYLREASYELENHEADVAQVTYLWP